MARGANVCDEGMNAIYILIKNTTGNTASLFLSVVLLEDVYGHGLCTDVCLNSNSCLLCLALACTSNLIETHSNYVEYTFLDACTR